MTQQDVSAPPLDVKLRRLCADRRWSGRHLAEQAGLSVSTTSRVLRGVRSPNVLELQALARALGVSAAALVDDETEPAPVTA